MDIKFVKESGRILSCVIEGKVEKSDDVIRVANDVLPKDFLAMFPMGKYLVRRGKIVENMKLGIPEQQPSKPGRKTDKPKLK